MSEQGSGQNTRWIQRAVKKPGVLRRALTARPGKPIPRRRLESAARKAGLLGRRARLALTLRGLNLRRRRR
jgi:hypothetical protein